MVVNGQEVLRALEVQAYDLALMDVQMPEIGGIETTKLIHSSWSRGPKIIAITSFDPELCREKCFSAGVDDFINKPIRINELYAAIDCSMCMISSNA